MLKAMYGGKDAAACWDEFAEKTMLTLGYKAGVHSPCVYFNEATQGVCVRHGDDFILLATREEQRRFYTEANKAMILKLMGVLGPSKADGDVQEIRCLNRIIRYVVVPYKSGADYIEWEADPRHVEILMSHLGLNKDSKSLGQPGAKREAGADETPLGNQEARLYKSATMRLAYLAQDRPDLQFVSKELARYMQSPSRFDLQQLKRAVRYLKAVPRLVQRFTMQDTPDGLTTFTDSDFAGCILSRKSTSCCMIFWGKHLLRSSSTTQAVLSLSSGEAEFYSAVKGASVSIGMVALLADMGVTPKKPISLRVDSTACLGTAGRRGAGRIRHIATPSLWIQRAVNDGRLDLSKVDGKDNPADLGTKVLGGPAINQILGRIGFVKLTGNSKLALKASV